MGERVILVQTEPRGPSQLIEIPVTVNGVNRVNFPDIQQLRSMANQLIITKGIRLITPDILTNGPITGFACAPIAELKKMSLVIYCEGWEKATYLPILTLNDVAIPGGVTIPVAPSQAMFNDWQNVDWSKSYLLYSNGTSSATQPYAVLLDVLYQKIDSDPMSKNYRQEIIGPS